MINISEEFINSAAPNESAVKNGLNLVKKKSFVKLCKSKDETLIFGECLGSGSSNYNCSVDFIKPESPVYRCTCPSRQIPCKHSVGLMYAYAKGERFEAGEIPQDIAEKREKAEKRAEKKKEEAAEPKKVNKSALAKKIAAQLEGLELLEKLIKDIIRRGFAAIDVKTLDMLEEQSKGLNSAYLPGAQGMLNELVYIFKNGEDRERTYADALIQASTIYSLCKRGKEHFKKRLQDPNMVLDTESNIDELLGHEWQISELETAGLYETDAELLQLFFNAYGDAAKEEFIDLGYWIDLSNGVIYKTCNYKPFRAAKHIKEDDSVFSIVKVNKLFIYPGDMNRRVRWEDMTIRELKKEDYIKVIEHAKKNYADAIKSVKNIIKNPLGDKNPVMLLHYSRIGKIENDYVIQDAQEKSIILRDAAPDAETLSVNMLHLIGQEALKGGAILVRFAQNIEAGELTAQPLTIINGSEIIRLAY